MIGALADKNSTVKLSNLNVSSAAIIDIGQETITNGNLNIEQS